ncbi:MAG TPA: hypothetical protein VNN22_22885 [Verrucomicrobiae bacterium]|nr:hypothetical protein [Verrucomicrobiae bacterium]
MFKLIFRPPRLVLPGMNVFPGALVKGKYNRLTGAACTTVTAISQLVKTIAPINIGKGKPAQLNLGKIAGRTGV